MAPPEQFRLQRRQRGSAGLDPGHVHRPVLRAGDVRLQIVHHLAGQPPVGASARIDALVELIDVAALGGAAPAQRTDLVSGPRRHVEAQQQPFGPALLQHRFGHIQRQGGGRAELAPVEIGAAHGQRRQAFDRALHRRRHRAGVHHVGAQVGAVIDAGEHQIRGLLQQRREGQLDAVGRVAAAGPGRDAGREQLIGPLGPQRRLQGEAVAGGGALLVGADHRHPVAPLGGFGRQGLDAVREDAVVVADQDAERRHARWGESRERTWQSLQARRPGRLPTVAGRTRLRCS